MFWSAIIAGILDPITKITGQIAQVRLEAEKAKTDKDRIAANERVKSLEARRDVLVKSGDNWFNGVIRALFAIPFIAYIWKLIIWDKVLGRGSTDALSSDLTYLLMVVVGFYFLHWTVNQFKK